MVIQNKAGNNILIFSFDIITLTAGFAATLIYFSRVRKAVGFANQVVSLDKSIDYSEDRASYGVELLHSYVDGF